MGRPRRKPGPSACLGWHKGKERMFFFEKKNQKTLAPWRVGPGEHTHQTPKVFCFFSSEKKTFLRSVTV
jgi:hypothetical protein